MTEGKLHSLHQGGELYQLPSPHHAEGNIIICPGGGYGWHSPREGAPVAEAFAMEGWAPWILYYTTGEGLGEIPMRQLAQAVALVGQLSGGPVVTCGFSAGGHVAACLGVHGHTLGLPLPAAQALCYPVITGGEYTHQESMTRLAGPGGDTAFYSVETHVTGQTPPTFLWHTAQDGEVAVQNSLLFAGALAEQAVPFEAHIFPKGLHGLSLATPEVSQPERGRYADPHVARWLPLCLEWLEQTVEKGA